MSIKNIIKILTAFITSIVIIHCSPGSASAAKTSRINNGTLPQNLSVTTVAALKDKKDVIVLDVREPSEYAKIHIPGVILIPAGEAVTRKSEYINYKTVVITCRSGNRSGHVIDLLKTEGHKNVHNMTGGIKAWIAAGLPTEP